MFSHLTPDAVVAAVAGYCGLEREHLLCWHHDAAIEGVRHIAVWACIEVAGFGVEETRLAIGMRPKDYVSGIAKSMADEAKADRDMAEGLAQVRKVLVALEATAAETGAPVKTHPDTITIARAVARNRHAATTVSIDVIVSMAKIIAFQGEQPWLPN